MREKGLLRVHDDLFGMRGEPLRRSRGASERRHSPGGVCGTVDNRVLKSVIGVAEFGAGRGPTSQPGLFPFSFMRLIRKTAIRIKMSLESRLPG